MLKPKIAKGKTAIIIGGRMYSGKSTVGLYINDQSINSYRITPFAETLKQLVHDYYGLTEDEAAQIKDQLRGDYQQLGTESVRKHYKENFWSILALRRSGSDYLIFDDCRYKEEIETVSMYAENSLRIWVYADEPTRVKRCDAKFGNGAYYRQNHNHSSESELTGYEKFWDVIVDNSEYNQTQVKGIVRQHIQVFENAIGHAN